MSSRGESRTMKAVVALLAVVFVAGVASYGMIKCQEGVQFDECFVEPCKFSDCPNYPNAVCKDDYCGACAARYFVADEEVTDDCSSDE